MDLLASAGGLLVTADHLPSLSGHFKLRAHLLDLRRLLVEPPSELCNGRLEVFLLLSHRRNLTG